MKGASGIFVFMDFISQPPFLKSGDLVAIISTARKIADPQIAPARSLFESWGLQVELGSHVFAEECQFAGGDDLRIKDLQWALDNPKVKAIFCSRGGYGTARLLDSIDWTLFQKRPKWIVGYSDVTALHAHVLRNFGICTLHATMPVNITAEPSVQELLSRDSMKNALWGKQLSYPLKEHPLNKNGDSSGKIMGGNLSIIYSLLGSQSSLNTDGAILFIEDLDEYLYHVDRMMLNVKRNGLFENLNALIVGGMTDMNDNTVPYGKNAEEIILEHAGTYNIPVYFGFDAGHQQPNLALPFGERAKLENNYLIFDRIGSLIS
jgi:muramoyltetrapeptide carboxypeptidase